MSPMAGAVVAATVLFMATPCASVDDVGDDDHQDDDDDRNQGIDP